MPIACSGSLVWIPREGAIVTTEIIAASRHRQSTASGRNPERAAKFVSWSGDRDTRWFGVGCPS